MLRVGYGTCVYVFDGVWGIGVGSLDGDLGSGV